MTGVLEVDDLSVDFGRRRLPAVRGISFSLAPGERLGLIGESGSGKSVTALSIMGLLPENARVRGQLRWRGENLVGRPDAVLSRLRGRDLAMVFQEPMTALDPTMRVGRQVAESYILHRDASSGQVRGTVLEALGRVGIEDPQRIADAYPHQLSGGQRQRALIAMALMNRPSLVICDEPTTALDVTVQATVLRVLNRQLASVQAGCLFISHDLAVVAQVCERVAVMWRGRIVETGRIVDILERPRHPYTATLVAAARFDPSEPRAVPADLDAEPGAVPDDLDAEPEGAPPTRPYGGEGR